MDGSFSVSCLNNSTEIAEHCNCTSWNEDHHGVGAIAVIRIVTSGFSILGSASIILGVLLTGKLSAAEIHPLFILSVADFILSILWMMGGIVWINPGPGGWAGANSTPHTGMCYVLAVSTTIMELVAFLLTAVYAQSALLRIREVYKNQGYMLALNDTKKRFRHVLTIVVYIASWVSPLLIVLPAVEGVVGIKSANLGCWCVLDFFNIRPDNGAYLHQSIKSAIFICCGLMTAGNPFYKFAVVHATILGVVFTLVTIAIAVMYVVTFLYALRVIRLQSTLTEENAGGKMIKTIVRRLSVFMIIFLISGLPVLMASFLVWSERNRLRLTETPDRIILYIHSVFSPLQGFLNAMVYGWSRKEFRRAVYTRKERVQYNRGKGYESLNHSNMPSGSSYFNTASNKKVHLRSSN